MSRGIENMALSQEELERYSRHIILKGVGLSGQKKLLQGKVLVIGAGGLGAPVLMYLAASGVGTLGIMDDDVLETSCIIQLSNPISFTMMDRLMGGAGSYTDQSRDFTEIEVELLTTVLKRMAALLKEPWGSYIDVNPSLTSVETNSRVVQPFSPDEVVIIVMLEVEIKDVKNTISICIPAMGLESIMAKFGDKWSRGTKKLDPKRENERKLSLMDAIKDSDLKIDAVLCETTLDLYDVLTLQEGDVIPLNIPIDSNITVKIGNNLWFDGKLGIKNNKKAVKIDNIYKELR